MWSVYVPSVALLVTPQSPRSLSSAGKVALLRADRFLACMATDRYLICDEAETAQRVQRVSQRRRKARSIDCVVSALAYGRTVYTNRTTHASKSPRVWPDESFELQPIASGGVEFVYYTVLSSSDRRQRWSRTIASASAERPFRLIASSSNIWTQLGLLCRKVNQ